MTLIYCTGWLSWRLFIWICCQHLLPSRLPSRESLELFILFRKIQQTATSKYQFSKTYWQSSLLYTIHIADPMFKYSGIYPTYFLHYEQDNGRRIFLLAGRKRKKCSTSTYVLSTDPTDLSRQGSSTLATLRSVQNLFFFIFIISVWLSNLTKSRSMCNCESLIYLKVISTPRRTSNGVETKD